MAPFFVGDSACLVYIALKETCATDEIEIGGVARARPDRWVGGRAHVAETLQ